MRRLNRKRLPVLCLGGLVKVAEGFAAANSMIWRQSPSATTVERNGGTRPLWIMQTGNLSMEATNATDGGLWGLGGTVGYFQTDGRRVQLPPPVFRHGTTTHHVGL
jgi:hypothetical protein